MSCVVRRACHDQVGRRHVPRQGETPHELLVGTPVEEFVEAVVFGVDRSLDLLHPDAVLQQHEPSTARQPEVDVADHRVVDVHAATKAPPDSRRRPHHVGAQSLTPQVVTDLDATGEPHRAGVRSIELVEEQEHRRRVVGESRPAPRSERPRVRVAWHQAGERVRRELERTERESENASKKLIHEEGEDELLVSPR